MIRPRDLAEGFRLITLNIPQELGLDGIITNHKSDWLIRIALLYVEWIETPMLKETIKESLLLLLNDHAIPHLKCFLCVMHGAKGFACISHLILTKTQRSRPY